MQNSKMKKGLAVALAASMVVGSSLTVLAADETSGELTGTGTSNGHVEQKAVKVVLPTVTGVDYFNYTVDPEGLITSTNKDHAGTTVTPNPDNVYFKLKDGTYGSSSELLEVENQSSVAIDLTVKTEVAENSNNIALANAADEVASAENALLYLGLKVGDATEVIKTTGASKTVQIAGVADNFEVKAKDGGGYEYAVKTSPAAWKKTSIGLTGKCNNKNITNDTKAPAVKVTWSWVDPSANAAPSVPQSTYTATQGTPVVIDINMGVGNLAATSIKSVSFVKPDGTTNVIAASNYTFDSATGKLTLPVGPTDAIITQNLGSRVFTITFNNDASVQVTVNAPAA